MNSSTTIIGDYVLGPLIGRGGAAEVYAAQGSDGPVALKICQSRDARARQRFHREIAALRQLRHPGLVNIIAAGEDAEPPWYAMEDLGRVSLRHVLEAPRNDEECDLATLVQRMAQHTSLSEHLQDAASVNGVESARGLESGESAESQVSFAALPEAVALALAVEVGEAMSHAHSRGLIHRDLKPGNIMLRDNGSPVVIDPGLVLDADDDQRLTASGDALGTMRYMAPEQFAGEQVDERADIYALGLILGEMLGFHILAPGSGGPSRLRAVRGQTRLPRSLRRIIACSTAADPRWRYPSMAALVNDLRRYRQGEKILVSAKPLAQQVSLLLRRYPQRTALLAIMLVTAMGLLATQWYQEQRQLANLGHVENLIGDLSTAVVYSLEQPWYRHQSYIAADGPSVLRTREVFPEQLEITVKWHWSPPRLGITGPILQVGLHDDHYPGWSVGLIGPDVLMVWRHGQPWWCTTIVPGEDAGLTSLRLRLLADQMILTVNGQQLSPLSFNAVVPPGGLGLRGGQEGTTMLRQWQVRISSLPDTLPIAQVLGGLIGSVEFIESTALPALQMETEALLDELETMETVDRSLPYRWELLLAQRRQAQRHGDHEQAQRLSEDLRLLLGERWASDEARSLVWAAALAMGEGEAQLINRLQDLPQAALDDWMAALWQAEVVPGHPLWERVWPIFDQRLSNTNPYRRVVTLYAQGVDWPFAQVLPTLRALSPR